MRDLTGQSLGSYRLIQLLGKSSFAEVYLGEHISLGTWVAIKVVRSKHLRPELQEAFKQQAHNAAKLLHPHIVSLLNFGIKEGALFLVERYIPGGTLRALHPRDTQLPVETILDYVHQVAAALQFAHDQRLIHQHIKPENMLLDSGGEVLVDDFGFVLPAQEVIGAALYMAPEQFTGQPQLASDQYAMGIVVYEWLTGDVPFRGAFEEIQAQHLSSPAPSLLKLRPDLHPAVEEVLARALAKGPEQRFPSMSDFATALEWAMRPTGRLNPSDSYRPATSLPWKAKQGEENIPLPPPPPSTCVDNPYAPFITPANPYTQINSVETYPVNPYTSYETYNPYAPSGPASSQPYATYDPYVPTGSIDPYTSTEGQYNLPSQTLPKPRNTANISTEGAPADEKQNPLPQEEMVSASSDTEDSLQWQTSQAAPEQTVVLAYPTSSRTELKDFFISYTRVDRLRAIWVAEQLHRAGYSTFLPPVDFREGFIFRKEMLKGFSKAQRMLIVLSPAYFAALQSRSYGWSSFKHAMKERAAMFFTVCIEMHEEIRKGLFGMENYIDIFEEDDATAQAMLRAYISDAGIRPRLDSEPDKNVLLSLIASSFARKDWEDVRRKGHYLIKEHPQVATVDIHRMYATALFELNYKSLAFDAFHKALTLVKGEERLPLLEDCVKSLTALGHWQEVLNYANEALRLAPRSAFCQEVRQQAEDFLQINDRTYARNPYAVKGLALFFSYSHKDAAMRQQLEKHLSSLKSRGLITAWHDGMILAGETREEKIAAYLNQADIVLVLVSPDFLASHYCYEQELRLAMARHEENKARVIPVILRPVATWEGSPLSKLQVVQPGGKAISEWPNKDAAYVKVVKEILAVVEELRGKL